MLQDNGCTNPASFQPSVIISLGYISQNLILIRILSAPNRIVTFLVVHRNGEKQIWCLFFYKCNEKRLLQQWHCFPWGEYFNIYYFNDSNQLMQEMRQILFLSIHILVTLSTIDYHVCQQKYIQISWFILCKTAHFNITSTICIYICTYIVMIYVHRYACIYKETLNEKNEKTMTFYRKFIPASPHL